MAETLADYRGNYKYNVLDANLRAFNAEVPAGVRNMLWITAVLISGRDL